MKAPKTRKAKTEKPAILPIADGAQLVTGTEFLLSMVETHWYSRHGVARKMEVRLKAEQELARLEEQIEQLQAVPGQTDDARPQVEQLHEGVEAMRRHGHAT